MTDEIQSVRPRETMPAPTSAGGEAAQDAARSHGRMPFDPHDFPVDGGALKEALAGIDVVRTLNAMQAFDSRITAAALYERRIKELAKEAKEA